MSIHSKIDTGMPTSTKEFFIMLQAKTFQMQSFLPETYEKEFAPRLKTAHEQLQLGTGTGGDFSGWVHLPTAYDKERFQQVQAVAERNKRDS